MPSGENKFYVDNPVSNEMYGTFIGKELVDFTRRSFPLSRNREDTYIGGLSMGGFGSIVNGLQNPETFGAVCAPVSYTHLLTVCTVTDGNTLKASKRDL